MNNDVDLWLEILDKTKQLFDNVQCVDNVYSVMQDAIVETEEIEKLLDRFQHFSLVFCGMTNVGKSTLLNAILGDIIAPTKNCPWSSTAVEYRYSTDHYEIIVPFDKLKILHRSFSNSNALLNELKRFAVHNSAFQTDKPLVVKIPNPLLKGDVTIVDTPGFGAADGTSKDALHDAILLDYLKQREKNIRVFWIVKDNISDSALNFYKDKLSKKCSDLIVNITDDFDNNFINSFEELYKPLVGHTVKFHYVDAKSAVKAQNNSNEELFDKSGISMLKDYLSVFSSSTGRTKIVAENLCNLFQSVSDYLYVTNRFSCTWQPTSWGTLYFLLQKANDTQLSKCFQNLRLQQELSQ